MMGNGNVRKRRTWLSSAVLASAIVLATSFGGSLPLRVAAAAPAATAASVLDPRLTTLLDERSANEKIPVIIRFTSSAAADAYLARADGVDPYARFHIVPGFAAELTRAQIELLQQVSDVVRIEPDVRIEATMDGATRWFGTLKARHDVGVDGDRDGNPRGYSRDDVVVAVIDTGIDASHVDLDGGKVIGWVDLVNGRSEPYDDNGHGTHVASIVAGEGDGKIAYQGVAPAAALVGIKVLAGDGSGQASDLIDGIEWAIENRDRFGIDILNMSLGTATGSDGQDAMSQAINEAVKAGLVAVVAAGNSGPALETVGSPGAAEQAITVCAMADPSSQGFVLGWFSSRGPTLDGRVKPDICGPGWEITAAKANSRQDYVAYSGTSMATPFVSGTVALMLDANPQLTPAEVKQLLRETAVDWGPPGPDVESGAGRLDGYAAITRAAGVTGQGPAVPLHRSLTGQPRLELPLPSPLPLPGPLPWPLPFAAPATAGTGSTPPASASAAQALASYEVPIERTDYPVAISLIIDRWQPFIGPDLDLVLYDPAGNKVAESVTDRRQETIRYAPTQTGTYRLEVVSKGWLLSRTSFVIDISGGLPGAPPPEPAPAPLPLP